MVSTIKDVIILPRVLIILFRATLRNLVYRQMLSGIYCPYTHILMNYADYLLVMLHNEHLPHIKAISCSFCQAFFNQHIRWLTLSGHQVHPRVEPATAEHV